MNSTDNAPVIIIATDGEYGDSWATTLSQFIAPESWPEVKIVWCNWFDTTEKTLEKYGDRVKGIYLDVSFQSGDYKGIEIAKNIREGKYANNTNMPIFLHSMGDFMPPKLIPPARIRTGLIRRPEIVDFFYQCKKGAVTEIIDKAQEIRDKAAKDLLEKLSPPNWLKGGVQGVMSREDVGSFLEVEINNLRHRMEIAFDGGAPSKEWLEKLKAVLVKGALYLPDDSHYNQYSLLLGQLRGKIDEALGQGYKKG